jgi:hypothetical protein
MDRRIFHKSRAHQWLRIVTFALGAPVICLAQGVLYVTPNARGKNDGTSWQDAFIDLQDALEVAQAGHDVWIAGGTYKPDRGTGERTMSFLVPAGVALYGGFAGNEECRDERDWAANETILSGDLNGDDGPRDCAEASDCCREHDYPGCDDPVCEQIVCASDSMCCQPFPPKVEFPEWDVFCAQAARVACCHLGGWRACENSMAVVRLAAGEATTMLDGLIVEAGYSIRDEHVFGGGVIGGPSIEIISNSEIRQNFPHGATGFADLFVVDSLFEGNGTSLTASSVKLADSSFSRNDYGIDIGFGKIVNCSFVDNASALRVDGHADIDGCLFVGNYQTSVVTVHYASATLSDCVFLNNVPAQVWASSASVALDRCLFANNKGAAIRGDQVNTAIRDSVFVGTYGAAAGVIDLLWESEVRVQNCSFYANTFRDPHINEVFPIGVSLRGAQGLVRNCTFWGVPADANNFSRFPTRTFDNAVVDVEYSIVEGWPAAADAAGNSGADPRFVDADGPDDIAGTEDDDLRLSPGSPAINAGDPDPSHLTPMDLDGHARVLCGRVDIGAYESGIGDYDCDEGVDLADFSNWEECMTGPMTTSDEATKPRSDEGTRRNAETPKNRNAKASDGATKPQRHRRHEGGAKKLRSDEGVVRGLAPAAQISACAAFDVDVDGDVDLADFARLHHVFVSP